jgi:membrane protein
MSWYLKLWHFIDDDDITLWSAGLTFFTLFATVPLLILMLSVFTQMPLFQELYGEFKDQIFTIILPDKSEVILSYLDSFLEGGQDIEYIYFGYIFVISMLFFRDYEFVVSRIFNREIRGLLTILGIYISLMIFAPVVFVYLIYLWAWLDLAFVSFFVSWALFLSLYLIASYRYHGFKSNLYASFIGSLTWFATKQGFVYYISYNHTYSTLYGSFSTLFIILFWIYLSWMIYLYGLKLVKVLDVTH